MNRKDLLVKEYMMLLQTQNGGKVIVDTRPALQAQLDKIESLGYVQLDRILKFIKSYFITTVEPDGERVHHLEDKEWQSVKSRLNNIKICSSRTLED